MKASVAIIIPITIALLLINTRMAIVVVIYDIVAKNEKLRTLPLPTYKAHNLILDIILSVGILGMLSYFVLWGYYIFAVVKSSNQKI